MSVSPGAPNYEGIRVFLLIDNRLLRETLIRLLQKKPDLHLVGVGSSTDKTATDIFVSGCDILVADRLRVVMQIDPGSPMKGPESRPTRCVLIGMEADEEQFLQGVRQGISGYLLADASSNDVVAAIRSVAQGESVCPPRLCDALFRYVARTAQAAQIQNASEELPTLTFRQQRLISLVGSGLTNKEIASQLNISEFTVRNHIHRIMKLVKAENRYEAVEAFRGAMSAKPS